MIFYVLTFLLGAIGVYIYHRRKKRLSLMNKPIITKTINTNKQPNTTTNNNNNNKKNSNNKKNTSNYSTPKETPKEIPKEIPVIQNIPIGSPQRIGNQNCVMKPLAGSNLLIEDKIVQNNLNYNYNHARGDVGVMGGGKWYYEMTLESNGQILIGWATEKWKLNPNANGLGNDSEGWAYDGYYGSSWNCGKNQTYGRNYWYNQETIGVGLDLDKRKIEFWRSGVSCGIAFENVPKDVFLYPAISLKQYQRVKFNFGENKFIYPQKDYLPLHSNLTESQKQELEKLFSQYKSEGIKLSESGEDYGDIIKEEGTMKLIKDLGFTDDNDPILFVI